MVTCCRPCHLENEEGILLSVPTKILQNQVMQEEAKRLEEIFHISIHSLKGPQNYLKLDAFHAALEEEESNRLYTRFKMQLLVWLTETDTGDLDEIGQLYRYQQFLPELGPRWQPSQRLSLLVGGFLETRSGKGSFLQVACDQSCLPRYST